MLKVSTLLGVISVGFSFIAPIVSLILIGFSIYKKSWKLAVIAIVLLMLTAISSYFADKFLADSMKSMITNIGEPAEITGEE